MKTLSKNISSGSQELIYKEILEHNGQKLRVFIESDSYLSQCRAKVDLWDGKKWNNIDYIHYGNMKTEAKLYYENIHRLVSDSVFKQDRDTLLKSAVDLINI